MGRCQNKEEWIVKIKICVDCKIAFQDCRYKFCPYCGVKLTTGKMPPDDQFIKFDMKELRGNG